VGQKGTEAFFDERGGLSPEQLEGMRKKKEAKALFQEAIFDLAERLRSLYESASPEEEKLAGRDMIFKEAKKSLARDLEALGSTRYRGIMQQEWNNAFLVSYLTYHEDPGRWEALFETFGSDLPAMVAWLKGLKGDKDPMDRIEKRLADKERTTNH
jgi:predicted aminopeptidase